MVLKYLTFIPDDPDFLNVRPGSPHPFFYLISSASSSPDVWSNCYGSCAASVASAHRRFLSTPVCEPTRVEEGAADEGRELASGRNSAGYPTYLAPRRVSEVGSLLSKVGGMTVGLIDTLGSFTFPASGSTKKGFKISVLAFEVASTISRAANLMESLSEESITHLTEVVLPSEGVQRLVSADMDELLKIAALDKMEELKVFLGEVVRFGNLSRDPQWHHLNRYFIKAASQLPNKQSKVGAETLIQQLMILVQNTAVLYYELYALDRLEQNYRCKIHEYDVSNSSHRGDRNSLSILRAETKARRKHVRSLKQKSLWSRTIEEVMEELVIIARFLHFEILRIFDLADCDLANDHQTNQRTLGSAGLALQYANVITHINAIVSQPSFVPPRSRDALYQALPHHVQSVLWRRLRPLHVPEGLTISEIKELMEEMLQWLVPMAAKTIKTHHSFARLGEWGNFVTSSNRKPADVIRIETLHHADIERTDLLILELIFWLHLLASRSRAQAYETRSPAHDVVRLYPTKLDSNSEARMQRPGTSRSLNFGNAGAPVIKSHHRLATSSSDSAVIETNNVFPGEGPSFPMINCDIDWIKVLDVIDGVDTMLNTEVACSFAPSSRR
ncbi:uncharacterized protein LOC116206270 isoform X1 [Punica granatum]|uniref:Uncharacterized protein LOC116206270 isoform X1 n=2 Tax=Punica granatum TaxID=22663 RepID=A0A6P8DEH0_PUNGR|nr:uncharacterized protein LOC116206270 isoform X1 [Punica granatum]